MTHKSDAEHQHVGIEQASNSDCIERSPSNIFIATAGANTNFGAMSTSAVVPQGNDDKHLNRVHILAKVTHVPQSAADTNARPRDTSTHNKVPFALDNKGARKSRLPPASKSGVSSAEPGLDSETASSSSDPDSLQGLHNQQKVERILSHDAYGSRSCEACDDSQIDVQLTTGQEVDKNQQKLVSISKPSGDAAGGPLTSLSFDENSGPVTRPGENGVPADNGTPTGRAAAHGREWGQQSADMAEPLTDASQRYTANSSVHIVQLLDIIDCEGYIDLAETRLANQLGLLGVLLRRTH